MKNVIVSRRHFFGLTLATAFGSTAIAQAIISQDGSVSNPNNSSDNNLLPMSVKPRIEGDVLIIISSAGLANHRHEISIPLEVFQNPRQQVIEFFSSKTAWHQHSIHLRSDQMVEIASGKTVIVSDSQWGEHQFEIYLPENTGNPEQ